MEWSSFPSVIIPQHSHFGWTSFRGEGQPHGTTALLSRSAAESK